MPRFFGGPEIQWAHWTDLEFFSTVDSPVNHKIQFVGFADAVSASLNVRPSKTQLVRICSRWLKVLRSLKGDTASGELVMQANPERKRNRRNALTARLQPKPLTGLDGSMLAFIFI